MRKSLKSLLAVLFVCILTSHVFAVDGVVTYVKGKVEVKRNNEWVSLKVGDTVSESEVINTGFQSEAKVKLMESVLFLGPVTRVTLDQLSSSSDRDKVNVYLSTGSVRSKVNRASNKKVNYSISNPIVVASVRGTDLIVDDSNNVICLEGAVAVSLVERFKKKPSKDADTEEEAEEEEEEDEDTPKEEDKPEDGTSDADSEEPEETMEEFIERVGGGEDGTEDSDTDKNETKSIKETVESMGELDVVTVEESIAADKAAAASKDTARPDFEIDYDKFDAFTDSATMSKEGAYLTQNKALQVTSTISIPTPKHTVEKHVSDVVSSITTEGSKQAGGDESIATSINSVISSGNIGGPKTGTINITVNPPAKGNLSVEVVMPK